MEHDQQSAPFARTRTHNRVTLCHAAGCTTANTRARTVQQLSNSSNILNTTFTTSRSASSARSAGTQLSLHKPASEAGAGGGAKSERGRLASAFVATCRAPSWECRSTCARTLSLCRGQGRHQLQEQCDACCSRAQNHAGELSGASHKRSLLSFLCDKLSGKRWNAML